MATHIIIDEGTDHVVGLALGLVSECADVDAFKAVCNPEWGWDEAKKEAVYTLATAELNGETPSNNAPKMKAGKNN